MAGEIVRLDINVRDTRRALNDLAYKQYPFAFASTLTETAKLAQIAVQNVTRTTFNLHGEFIPKGIRIQPAKASEVRTLGTTDAAVYTAPRISTFMPGHEVGEVRKPSGMTKRFSKGKGRTIAIPSRVLRKKPFRTKTGRVKERWLPGRLLHKGGRRSAFVMGQEGAKEPVIARLRTPRAQTVEILYVLVPQARIDKRWNFVQTVRLTADAMFFRVFNAKMRIAIETAK